jgi:hypothetical protein
MTRLLIAVLFVLSARIAQSQTTSTCRPSDDDGLELRNYVRELVSTNDPNRTALRTYLGLKAMDSTKVAFVSDNTICNKVALGMNTAFQTPGLIRQLYVVVAGQVYAAMDTNNPLGEWWGTTTLDNKFKAIKTVLAP